MADVEKALSGSTGQGALMILDIDHFKSINDTFGHMAGDRVLREFAAAISRRLVEKAVFGRYGGEEFALFLPQHEMKDALALAESLLRTTRDLAVDYHGQSIRLTVSIGVACVSDCGADLERLMICADSALYDAKKAGRNRVQRFSLGATLRRAMDEVKVQMPAEILGPNETRARGV